MGQLQAAKSLGDDLVGSGSEGELLAIGVLLERLQFVVAQHRNHSVDPGVLRRARSRSGRSTSAGTASTPAALLGCLFLRSLFFACSHLSAVFLRSIPLATIGSQVQSANLCSWKLVENLLESSLEEIWKQSDNLNIIDQSRQIEQGSFPPMVPACGKNRSSLHRLDSPRVGLNSDMSRQYDASNI